MLPILNIVLNEAASPEEYMQMFPDLYIFNRKRKAIGDEIEWAIRVLKKNSRVLWYLKMLKIILLGVAVDRDKQGEDTKEYKLYGRERRKLIERVGEERCKEILESSKEMAGSTRAKTLLEHYFDSQLYNFQDVREYDMSFKTWYEIREELEEIEKRHMKEDEDSGKFPEHRIMSFSTEKDTDQWDTFYELGGEYKWLITGSYHSYRLARAMSDSGGTGHCGTCQNRDSRILVLAQFLDEDRFVPHLTFELSSDNEILQSKGYLNSKPAPKYHEMIVDMLMNTQVETIRGGNYKPETDFKFEDLSQSYRDELEEAKPDITNPRLAIVREYEKNGASDRWFKLAHDTIDSWLQRDPVSDNVMIKIYGHSTLGGFLEGIGMDDYKKLIDGEFENDDEEYARTQRYGYEEEIIGSEFYDGINYESFRGFMETAMSDPTCSDHIRKKIPGLTGEALYRKIWDRKDKVSAKIRELAVRSIAFGLYRVADLSLIQLEYMYFISDIRMGQFYLSLRDDDGKPVRIEDIKSFKQFMNLHVYFLCSPQDLMEEVEGWTAYSEYPLDNHEMIFGDDEYTGYHADDIKEEGDFSYYLNNRDSARDDYRELSRKEYERRRGEEHESGSTVIQTDMFGYDSPQHETRFDSDAALEYMKSKLFYGVPESLSRRILGTIRG